MSLNQKLLSQLADLRFELIKGPKARRQRFRLFDRLTQKIVAKFEDESHAITSLDDYRRRYISELTHELAQNSVPALANA